MVTSDEDVGLILGDIMELSEEISSAFISLSLTGA